MLRGGGAPGSPEDHILCILRNVGTFPTRGEDSVVPDGAVSIREVRHNMTDPAVGELGFNPPSLLGLAVGAPYFHAGNARTLEELFDEAFAPHHQAFSPGFVADERAIRQLVAFLLSVDGDTPPELADLGFNPDLCPTLP